MTLPKGTVRVKAGGYWRSGKWIAMTWGDKIKIGLAAREKVKKICQRCGKEYETAQNARNTAKWCSFECMYANNYTDTTDPVLKKAKVIGANLLMGKGKLDFLHGIIKAAIHTPCVYCGTVLNIHNLTVDHREAYGNTEIRRSKKINEPIRRLMDRRENLHVICHPCNMLKYDLNHDQFLQFLSFLNSDEKMKLSITKRLKRAHAPFARKFA